MELFFILATISGITLQVITVFILWIIFAALTDTKTIAGTLSKAKQLIHSKVSFISPTKLKAMLEVEKHLIDKV